MAGSSSEPTAELTFLDEEDDWGDPDAAAAEPPAPGPPAAGGEGGPGPAAGPAGAGGGQGGGSGAGAGGREAELARELAEARAEITQLRRDLAATVVQAAKKALPASPGPRPGGGADSGNIVNHLAKELEKAKEELQAQASALEGFKEAASSREEALRAARDRTEEAKNESFRFNAEKLETQEQTEAEVLRMQQEVDTIQRQSRSEAVALRREMEKVRGQLRDQESLEQVLRAKVVLELQGEAEAKVRQLEAGWSAQIKHLAQEKERIAQELRSARDAASETQVVKVQLLEAERAVGRLEAEKESFEEMAQANLNAKSDEIQRLLGDSAVMKARSAFAGSQALLDAEGRSTLTKQVAKVVDQVKAQAENKSLVAVLVIGGVLLLLILLMVLRWSAAGNTPFVCKMERLGIQIGESCFAPHGEPEPHVAVLMEKGKVYVKGILEQ